MGTYIILASYTEQGVRNIKESPARLDAARAAFQAVGAELKSFYLTMGRHDIVSVVEAPDDATVARLLLNLAAQGNVRTETLKAFSEAEFREMVAGL